MELALDRDLDLDLDLDLPGLWTLDGLWILDLEAILTTNLHSLGIHIDIDIDTEGRRHNTQMLAHLLTLVSTLLTSLAAFTYLPYHSTCMQTRRGVAHHAMLMNATNLVSPCPSISLPPST